MDEITPKMLLNAYAQGYFPMAQSREEEQLYWFHPEERGVLPLEPGRFHIPRRLQRVWKQRPYCLTADRAFGEVIRACAEIPRDGDGGSWINGQIIALYSELHRMGYAHSIEAWEGEMLAGGLYGVSLGGAFFGESMFSRRDHASKLALIALVEILREAGYTLLDTQYVNDHLRRFGVQAISAQDYEQRLRKALYISPNPSMRFVTVSGNILSAS